MGLLNDYINKNILKPEEVKERLNVCFKCEEIRTSWKFLWWTFKRQPFCNICKCSLKKKSIFRKSKCPKDKWKI